MEIKQIVVPENWECIIEDGVAAFREKKQKPPRSWKKFCEEYPVKKGEAFIDFCGNIGVRSTEFGDPLRASKNWCTSKEEAEAFLALMQLRQLRKAWVGDWKCTKLENSYGIVVKKNGSIEVGVYETIYKTMLFPTREMANDFINCFRNLCETAKILL